MTDGAPLKVVRADVVGGCVLIYFSNKHCVYFDPVALWRSRTEPGNELFAEGSTRSEDEPPDLSET